MSETTFSEKIEVFLDDLKYGRHKGSFALAMAMADFLRKAVANTRWKDENEIRQVILKEGQRVVDAFPKETSLNNILCKFLKVFKDECSRISGEQEEKGLSQSFIDESKRDPSSKSIAIDVVNELITEIENSRENIASQALEIVHSTEVILTMGNSRTVEMFLKKVAKKRKFQVIVAETAPGYEGHKLAASLSAAGVETTLITDSAIFAMMARVNKVIIGAHTITPDGGLKSLAGTLNVAQAAKFHSVPLIVCAPIFKFSNQRMCSFTQDSANVFLSQEDILPYASKDLLAKVEVKNYVFDFIPPGLVTLIITNIGGSTPSQMHRILNEIYE